MVVQGHFPSLLKAPPHFPLNHTRPEEEGQVGGRTALGPTLAFLRSDPMVPRADVIQVWQGPFPNPFFSRKNGIIPTTAREFLPTIPCNHLVGNS